MSGPVQKEALAVVRGAVRAWIAILEVARSGLLGLAAAIPASPGEVDPEVDLDAMDEPTELRSVLRNVAEDDLRPAVQDLRDLLREEER